ncbi:MAG: hypothetical protein C0490_28155, partial [Marivirga sp.]|nr:hypothetical protein [Marivirga sp.]
MSDLTTSRLNSYIPLTSLQQPHFLRISFILILFYTSAFSQSTSRVDSLKTELNHTSSDVAKIRIYHELADAADKDSRLAYSKQALSFAKKSQDSKLIMESLIHLGSLYSATSNYKEALEKLNEAVNVGVTGNLSGLLPDAYLELGIIFLRQQNLDSARTMLNKSLALVPEKGKEVNRGLVFNMLGNVAKEENNFTDASEYYIQA